MDVVVVVEDVVVVDVEVEEGEIDVIVVVVDDVVMEVVVGA